MADKEYIVLRSQPIMVPPNANVRGAGAQPFGGGDTLQIEETTLTKAQREDLRRDPRTRAIAESMPMKLIEPTQSEDIVEPSATSDTWGIRAVRANESPFTGNGITVAVLDTGIDPNHSAFQGVDLVQRNFTLESDNDQNGHGTHCAGTIFGKDVDDLRIGIARNVSRALIGKVLGEGGGSSATIAKAIQWAVNEGAHVVSMSLGIDFPGYVDFLVNQRGLEVNPATSVALEAYRANVNLFSELGDFVHARGAFGQGTIIVAASGNESNRPDFEIAVAPPAAGTRIVAVGALQEGPSGFSVASFSNNQVNISAPGVGVISAAVGGGLRSLSGTSMATPHVAGVAALWAEKLLTQTGRVDNETLLAQVLARGEMSVLASGSEAEDVGTGMAQAPLS